FPTTRDEDWRYTNLASLAATPFTRPSPDAARGLSAETLTRLGIDGADWPRLVFVDGRLAHASPGRPSRARVTSLADAMRASTGADNELLERQLTRHANADGN